MSPARVTRPAEVVRVTPCGDGVLLTARLEARLDAPLEGGHFFMLRTTHDDFPFLSRPFSVHDARPDGRGPELTFLLKVVGPGTSCLARLGPGQELGMVGPLGCPFPPGDAATTTVLVAGGVGLPPLFLYLRRRQEEAREEPAALLYGARGRDQLYGLDRVRELGVEVRCATEDGSEGYAGRVDGLLEQVLDAQVGRPVRILTCGPDPMMKAVASIAAGRGLSCLVSLETEMACGFGVCNACAVPVRQEAAPGFRFARACMEGPVLDASRILWERASAGS